VFKKPQKEKVKLRAGKEDIFNTFLYKLRKALADNELSDTKTELNITFKPEEKYDTFDDATMKKKNTTHLSRPPLHAKQRYYFYILKEVSCIIV